MSRYATPRWPGLRIALDLPDLRRDGYINVFGIVAESNYGGAGHETSSRVKGRT